jgi:transglutaminase-like putative cysteine protease
MRYAVTHITRYEYAEPVLLCQNLAHLTVRPTPRQRCLRSEFTVRPAPAVSTQQRDYFGNAAGFFSVQEPHRELVVAARHDVEVLPYEPPAAEETPPWEQVRDALRHDRTASGLDAYQFVFDSPYVRPGAESRDYARASFIPGRPLLEAALDLNRRIHAEFTYDQRATTVATPLREVFSKRRGVCQDFAHLAIACLRSLGLAARYVSGYLATGGPSGKLRPIGADASHAWVSLYCPGDGWVDFDPTNDVIPGAGHITLAWGRDFDDVSPVKGVILGGGEHVVRVGVDVVPEVAPGAEPREPLEIPEPQEPDKPG